MECFTSQKGFHSLEVVISIALFSLLVTGVFLLFGSSITEGNGLLKQARANVLVNESFNVARAIAREDWSMLTAGAHGFLLSDQTWSLFGEADSPESGFIRSIFVTDLENNVKQIDVSIRWFFFGRTIVQTASTLLTNWKQLEVWGNWGVPIVVGSLDIGPQGQASGVARAGNYAFLTAEISSENRPSLYAISIADPTLPLMLDSYVTGESLYDLALVTDQYLYTVGKSDALIVFDVSDPNNLLLVSSIPTDDENYSILVDGLTVYVGTEHEILVYDVSVPQTPVLRSRYATNANVKGMTIDQGFLYAATSATTQEVMIFSLENPSQLTLVSSIDLTGSTDAFSVATRGNILYVGRDNYASTNPELYQFDKTDPTNIVLKNELDVGGGIQQIAVAGPYVYLATGSSNNEFQIWQTGSNWQMLYTAGINLAQMATGVTFDNNTIFLSLRSNDAFQVIQPSP